MQNDLDQRLSSLNPAQHHAVTTPPGHQLVLAGAGSGKTRVLVHRIAFLIQRLDVSPHSILSVSYTHLTLPTKRIV